jgi:hypothetical protein
MGVAIAQFGADGSAGMTTTELSIDKQWRRVLFKPADFVSPKYSSIPNDISGITMPLV